MKRCVIFFFYDKEGVADRYIFHILQDLKGCSERIVFICNGKLSAQSRRDLSKYTEDIIVRKNEGFDVWAYKAGLSYLGWEKICSYDELVMMNFTIFPTLYSFCGMFDDMERITADFWGVTAYFEGNTAVAGHVPDHIQSHFIAVRRPMLCSYEFKQYWENMRPIQSYSDSIKYHESKFKKHFEERGFKSYIFAAAEELRPLTSCPAYWRQQYLLQNTHTPLIKRKVFYYPPYDGILFETAGEAAVDVYNWLKNSGSYDVNMIWENILRTSPMTDIKNALQLNYVFPHDRLHSTAMIHPSVGVILFAYSCDFVDQFKKYFAAIPQNAEIHILSPLENVDGLTALFSGYQKVTAHKAELGQLASTAILHFLLDTDLPYEYLLILQINISDRANYAAAYKSMECLLKSPEFVQNIFEKFEDEPHLGLLFPSPPNNEKYTSMLGREGIDFADEVISITNDLNIAFDASQSPVAPYFGMYWCRGETMRAILRLCPLEVSQKVENERRGFFEFWNVVIGLLAQKQGYYSAWSYHQGIAAIDLTNAFFYLNKLISSVGAQSKDDMWQLAGRVKKQMNFRRSIPNSTTQTNPLQKIFKGIGRKQ